MYADSDHVKSVATLLVPLPDAEFAQYRFPVQTPPPLLILAAAMNNNNFPRDLHRLFSTVQQSKEI